MNKSDLNPPKVEVSGLRDEEAKVSVYGGQHTERIWQLGDLINVGNRPERRLVINLTPGRLNVSRLSDYAASHRSEALHDWVVDCYYLRSDLLGLNTESGAVPMSFS